MCKHEQPIGHFCDQLVCFENVWRSEEHTSELQSQSNLVCRLLLEKKKKKKKKICNNRKKKKNINIQNEDRPKQRAARVEQINTLESIWITKHMQTLLLK